MSKTLVKEDLSQFTGTAKYYKHFTGSLVYTDGVKYLADKAGAHWLIDIVASYRRKEPFQVWELKVADQKGVVTMKEDTDKPELVKQKIPFTDFPLESITLYLIDGVLLLPSEY